MCPTVAPLGFVWVCCLGGSAPSFVESFLFKLKNKKIFAQEFERLKAKCTILVNFLKLITSSRKLCVTMAIQVFSTKNLGGPEHSTDTTPMDHFHAYLEFISINLLNE